MKLCLGTVQLGQKYGINNQIGRKPSSDEAYFILQKAKDLGIDYIDTANAYGDAEILIKESGVLADGTIKVITKISADVTSNYEEAVSRSLNRLGVDRIDGVMLHDWRNYCDVGQREELRKLKKTGLVDHIGVSVYKPEEAFIAVKDGIVDYIQVPYNILDQRLDKRGFFDAAKRGAIHIFARSAFLQGLLLMEADKIPDSLSGAISYIKKIDTIIAEYGFTRAEAALLFSYTHSDIDKVVFGVDSVEQLIKNVDIINKSDKFHACRKALINIEDGIDSKILNPSLWED